MDYIRFHARLRPGSAAVTDLTFDNTWTYQSFDRFVAQLTTVLANQGIGQGDRVANLSKNRAEVIALHFSCLRLGAIFVPLNWRLSKPELEQILTDCNPAIVFGDDFTEAMDIESQDIGLLLKRCSNVEPVWPEQKSVDLPSLMLYTSGTTGKPKGVLLSERNLTETAINFSLLGEVERASHFLCESPMFHIIGIETSIRAPFLLGAHISISDQFIPARTFDRLSNKKLGFSHYFCVPQMALALREVEGFDASKLDGLTAIFTGGAPHPESQIREWLKDKVPVVDGYGMTEAGTVFGMPVDLKLLEKKAGSVGIATPRVQARLVDDNNQISATGVPGELQLKGDNITVGYWRRDNDYQASLSEDGWFKTGDILTCDEDGYYTVTDRKKDMFISGGENVYPVEIEAQLADFASVHEAAVIGVPNEKWGEVGCLFYVAKDGPVSLEEIENYLSSRLAKYKIPKEIRSLKSLPRNAVGKLLRQELRKIYKA